MPLSGDPKSLVGLTIDGCELVELVSESMAFVYRARQRRPQREVALKMPRGGRLMSAEVRRRFELEIELNVGMSHPSIVGILQVGDFDGVPYYTMPFIEGDRLDHFLETRKFSMEESVSVFRNICGVVKTLHEAGMTHRDLKSPNILIDKHGEVRLLDFGLARLSADPASGAQWTGPLRAARPLITQIAGIAGTRQFMAPEQTYADSVVTPAADVYALGVIFYWILTRQYPYRITGDDALDFEMIREARPRRPREFQPSLPAELDDLVMACLEKSSSGRPQNGTELIQRLDEFLRRQEARLRSLRRVLPFRTWPATLGVGVVVLGLSLAVPALFRWQQQRAALRRIVSTYSSIKSYHDVSQLTQRVGGKAITAHNELSFERPNRLRFQSLINWFGKGSLQVDCYCNGTNLWIHIPSLNQYMEKAAPASVMDLVDQGARSDPVNDLFRYVLKTYEPLVGRDPESVIVTRAERLQVSKATLLERQEAGYRLIWTESRPLAVATNRGPATSFTPPVTVPLVAVARERDGMFVEMGADLTEIYRNLRFFPMVGTNFWLEAKHSVISTNSIDPSLFTFVPGKAQKVARFSWSAEYVAKVLGWWLQSIEEK